LVTLTFLAVAPAVGAITKVAVTVLSFTTVMLLAVTPVPETVTLVVPVRPTPVMVTGTDLPAKPDVGLMLVSNGPVTVNPLARVALPPGVLTVTVCPPSGAPVPVATANVAVMVVSLTTTTLLTTMPVPALTAVAPVKSAPVRVTLTV
jgi:hypothetical protein